MEHVDSATPNTPVEERRSIGFEGGFIGCTANHHSKQTLTSQTGIWCLSRTRTSHSTQILHLVQWQSAYREKLPETAVQLVLHSRLQPDRASEVSRRSRFICGRCGIVGNAAESASARLDAVRTFLSGRPSVAVRAVQGRNQMGVR